MDTKWKSYSHSLAVKFIVFIIVIVCFTGTITAFVNMMESNNGDFEIIFEENYYESRRFMRESENIVDNLMELIVEYKNEEFILNGGTVTEEEISKEVEDSPSLSEKAQEEIRDTEGERQLTMKVMPLEEERKLTEEQERRITEDLQRYNSYLRKLNDYKGVVYYAGDGENTISNIDLELRRQFTNTDDDGDNITNMDSIKEYFKTYPSYILLERFGKEVYPKDMEANEYRYWLDYSFDQLNQNNGTVYVAFADEFFKTRIADWANNKEIATNSLYKISGYFIGLLISFIYLILIIGRNSFKDKEVHLNSLDRLYNDINLAMCLGLIILWVGLLDSIRFDDIHKIIMPWTAAIAILGLILVLSLIKHLKNKTILKHTLTFTLFSKLFRFAKDIFNSGSLGVKIALIVILYPIIAAGTFFMFPITIGFAVWLANKKVKEFNTIKEGVERVKNGEIHHEINLSGDGEFAQLASDINSITDGLNKAVDNELKSERLKTELITNVSHDIRTPLTSIITYVDLLKKEEDKSKINSYIDVLDQKSQRLKILTDDLFEAAKASSGSIPVNYEKIDIVSLITQGLGELNHKIEESKLEFKINYPQEKIYVKADGKLLWRAIENLLSNIFKYALKGSRVYIDIIKAQNGMELIIKNISAYELNITSEELMERFKRGDESRSSQGSGLGLSIAKSLVEAQRGDFEIEIDGDLFKAIIRMPITN